MGKFWYLTSMFFLLTVSQFVLLSAQACNERGWFGSKCQYQCNCRNERCDSATGECVAGSSCEKGWFGPACQYDDLTTTEPGRTTPIWLYDGDDMTCNHYETLDEIKVLLDKPFPFTWLRLYVSDKGDQDSIKVHFKDDKSSTNDNMVDCNNKRAATVDEKSLIIYCDLDILVQQVILTGEGVRSLCTVNISGGRQIALRQPTAQSSPAFSSNSFRAVDGEQATGSSYCTSTSKGDTNPNWNVTFEQPKAINRFLVTYGQDKNEYITHVLTCYDKNDTQLFQKQRYVESTSVTYYTTEVRPVAPVSVIDVKVSSAPPSYRPLILCELQAYGDTVCPQGKYGRECEHSCDNCFNQECFVATGECPLGCADGFVGRKCQTPCAATYYGKDCGERCSTDCVDRLCDNIHGICDQCVSGKKGHQCDEECPPRMHGPNCEIPCSTRCMDQLCHSIYGICNRCLPGYFGDSCDTPCESDRYGQDCAKKCNPRCLEDKTLSRSACDHVNGTCILGCIDGRCDGPREESLSAGAIAGIAVGGIVVFIIAVLVLLWSFLRNQQNWKKGGCCWC